MTLDHLPELLTVREVASVLRLHRRTVERRIMDGTLTAVGIGRAVRIPREELQAALSVADHRQTTAARRQAAAEWARLAPAWGIDPAAGEGGAP